MYVWCAILMRWEKKGEENRCLEQYGVVMCQTSKNPMYVISSSVDSLLSFLFFFLLSHLLASFFLYVFCYTFNCTKSKNKEKRAITESVMAAIPQVSIITSSSSSLLYFYKLTIE